MSAAMITQAQDKGLRHQFAALSDTLLDFCRKLYAAHGGMRGLPGWTGEKAMSPQNVREMADRFEAHSPSLATELRTIASRG